MTTLYTFATQTGPIALSELDFNFSAPITLGSTNVLLGGAYNTLAGLTLTNPTFTTPTLGTPISGTLTNCTGYTYTNLTGTVPTWNQNTTGTAANVTGVVSVVNGGTGATNATTARTNLGLGTIATQAASSVAIDGGNINGTSVGGTTASTGKFTTLEMTSVTDASSIARNAGLSGNTTVTNQATFTTAGLTLASQTPAAGSTWRIRAYGQFTAVSSATVRTAQIACFWGTTQLVAITPTVLASTAQTTQWQVEFELVATSATAMWTTGSLMSRISSATALAIDNATPASTTISGAQTIDLRVRVSTAVASESWIIQQVTMERLE